MVRSAGLILIGYWDGPSTCPGWPSVKEFVDAGGDAEERELVADYLRTGLVARRCMGYSPCRFCGRNNGCLELTDGHFVWPDGLPHYVTDHDVRLPVCFVQHVLKMTDRLETAQRDETWWRHIQLPPHVKGCDYSHNGSSTTTDDHETTP